MSQLVSYRAGFDIVIREARRVVAGNCRNVMAQPAKVGNEAKISALVEEKLHKGVASEAPTLGVLSQCSASWLHG